MVWKVWSISLGGLFLRLVTRSLPELLNGSQSPVELVTHNRDDVKNRKNLFLVYQGLSLALEFIRYFGVDLPIF